MNVLDSRTLQEELDALEAEYDEAIQLDPEDVERMMALRELAESVGSDWHYGVTLIDEDDFQEWTQEYAEEIGAIDTEVSWPYTCIDWKQAANDLRMDYSCVTFAGRDYLFMA